jgi:hypothetical protein
VIRQALSELDVWEVEAKFSFIGHQASTGEEVPLIKDWKDILNKVKSSTDRNLFNLKIRITIGRICPQQKTINRLKLGFAQNKMLQISISLEIIVSFKPQKSQ